MSSNRKFPSNKGGMIGKKAAHQARQAWQKAHPHDTKAILWGVDFLMEALQKAKANGATEIALYLAKTAEGKTTLDANFINEEGKYVASSTTTETTATDDQEFLNDPFLCPPYCPPCDPDDPDCDPS